MEVLLVVLIFVLLILFVLGITDDTPTFCIVSVIFIFLAVSSLYKIKDITPDKITRTTIVTNKFNNMDFKKPLCITTVKKEYPSWSVRGPIEKHYISIDENCEVGEEVENSK